MFWAWKHWYSVQLLISVDIFFSGLNPQGKYYLLIENFSQLYRMLVPVPLWFAFFTEYNYGGEYFAVIATTIYLLLKVRIGMMTIVWFQKISIPPSRKDVWFEPLTPWKCHFSFIFGFWDPSPPQIPNDLPWGGYGYFLEPHITNL